jgi:hypothetical protein
VADAVQVASTAASNAVKVQSASEHVSASAADASVAVVHKAVTSVSIAHPSATPLPASAAV